MLGKIGLVVAIGAVIAVGVALTSPFDSKGTARLQNAAGVDAAVSPPNVQDQSKWVRTFDDEFLGSQLDRNKWVTCYDTFAVGDNGCTNTGNAEQEWYMPSQVSVAGGSSTLMAVKNPVRGIGKGAGDYSYRSGMISTGRPDKTKAPKWSTTYGYFEARIKTDGGQGVWPAFWLLPIDGSWPPEIDVMEILGNQPDVALLTVHWPSPQGPQKDSTSVKGPDLTKGWHTYGVNWQPKRIDWYIDGKLRKTVSGSNVPNKPMEIIFDLAIGGRLPGNTDASTQFPRSMSIDYVHAYELRK